MLGGQEQVIALRTLSLAVALTQACKRALAPRAQDKPGGRELDAALLARKTPGMSGADLANLVRARPANPTLP